MVARNLREIIPAFFVGPGGQPLTEEQARTRQELAESLLAQATDTSPTAGGWTSVFAKGVQGLAAGRQRHRAEEGLRLAGERDADLSRSLLSGVSLGSPAATSSLPLGAAPVGAVASQPLDPISQRVSDAHTGGSILPSTMLSALDSTEGGGAYDTLFGYANRSGPFAGVDVSQMSVGDALAFADPRGQYAQHVKSQIGRVATPMGRHQIVGTTLRNAVNQLGIDPSTPFNSTTQDAIALHLAKNRVNSASSLDGKISALRSEWEGFKNVPRDQMAQIVSEIETAPDPAQILRGVPLPAGIGSESLVGRPLPEGIGMEPMAYAPQQPQGGPLAAAPFASAGLPVAPVAEDVIVATTPEEVLAAEMATGMITDPLSLPENQITMDYVEPQGGAYVDPVVARANPNGIVDLGPGRPGERRRGPDGQMYQYVETSGMAGDSGGWGWIRAAEDGPIGMGIDPNDPSTIPAMAGGTRDVITALDPSMGYFPPAPSASGGAFPPAPTAQAAASSPSPTGGGASVGGVNPAIIEALSSPYASAQTKQIAGMLLEQQMQAQDPMRAIELERAQLELDQMRNPQPGYRVLSPEEAQSLGLAPDKAYQIGPDGKVGQVGGSMVEVNVNNDTAPGLGKLSSDYGYVMDPETRQPVIDPNTGLPQAAPVPGSPAARAIQEEEAAKAAGKRNASDYARTVTQDVGIADSYLSEIDGIYASDGIVGANLRSYRASIPGTPEFNMRQFVDSALSNVTLDTMNRMRETSAAGATGMGNMSDKQLKVIQGVLGQWDPALPVADQRMILHRLGNFYLDVQFGTKQERAEAVRDGRMTQEESAAIEQIYYPETRDLKGRRVDGSGGDLPEPKSKSEMDALPSGTRFRAPDGSIRIKP